MVFSIFPGRKVPDFLDVALFAGRSAATEIGASVNEMPESLRDGRCPSRTTTRVLTREKSLPACNLSVRPLGRVDKLFQVFDNALVTQ